VADAIWLLAPFVREEVGPVTRLRRYEEGLRAWGAQVSIDSFQKMSLPHKVNGHTHILDPLSFVESVVARQGEHAAQVWWPAITSAYSVTVTRLPMCSDSALVSLFVELLTRAQTIIAPTDYMAKELQSHYKVAEHALVVMTTPLVSISQSTRSNEVVMRVEHAIQSSSRVLLCVSAIAPERHLDRFVRVAELTRYVFPDVAPLLVGPVLDTRFARRLLPQLQSVGIMYLGTFARAEMPDLYERAAVLYEPLQATALPASVGEALACSVPVVAHETLWGSRALTAGMFSYRGEAEALRWTLHHLRAPSVREQAVRSALDHQDVDQIAREAHDLYTVCTR